MPTTTARRALVALLGAALVATSVAVGTTPAAANSSVFDDWTQSRHGGVNVDFVADTTIRQSGDAALRIENRTPKAPNVYGQLTQSVSVTPGTTYEFRAWVKTQDVASASGVYVPLDPSWSTRQLFPGGTTDWQELTWSYTMPAGQTQFVYRIITQDSGTTWIDDLSMTASGAATNLLANAGFESAHTPPPTVDIADAATIYPAGSAEISLSGDDGDVVWEVRSAAGQLVREGVTTIASGQGAVTLHDLGVGYYGLTLRSGDTTRATSLGVLAGNAAERLDSHAFNVSHHIGQTNANQLEAIAGPLGVGSLRFDATWTNIERTAGVYTFPAVYETQFERLVDLGIRPLVILNYRHPLYDDNRTPSTPEGIAAFTAYARAVAEHYGDAADYEVYNEYNHTFNDGLCGRTADCYLEILQPVSAAIRDVAPGARVVGPVLAEVDMAWLERLFELGGLDHLDVVSVHTYDWPSPPEGESDLEALALRELIREYNDGQDKPIWWTETGWPTPTSGNTEAEQANYTVRGMLALQAAGVEKVFVYALITTSPDPANLLGNYGIVRENTSGLSSFAPKPAFVAMAVLNELTSGRGFDGRDALSDEVYSYRYSSAQGETTRVLWATEPTTITVEFDGPGRIVETYGREHALSDGAEVSIGLSGAPVYIDGAVSRLEIDSDPPVSAQVPAQIAEKSVAPVAVHTDRAGVEFSDGIGAAVTVSGDGILPLTPATRLGVMEVRIQAYADGELIGLLQTDTEVMESPTIQLLPELGDGDRTAAVLRVDNSLGTEDIGIDQVTWELGDQTGAVTAESVAAGDVWSVELTEHRFALWHPLDYRVDVTIGGEQRSREGRTAFAPINPSGSEDQVEVSFTDDGTWVSNGGFPTGPEDLGGTFRVGHDEHGLTITARIVDDSQVNATSATALWQADSLQFAASPGLPGSSTQRVELGVGLTGSGPVVYAFSSPSGPVPSAAVSIERDDATGTTDYEITVPWSILGIDRSERSFAFSILVNDNDTGTREGYYEWGAGIGASKDPAHFLPVQLITPTAPEPEPEPAGWQAEAVYLAGDEVQHDGRTFVAQWWTSGEAPGSSASGAWAERGTPVACSGSTMTTWTPSWVYTGGETVVHGERAWLAKWWTRNQEPGASDWGPWEASDAC